MSDQNDDKNNFFSKIADIRSRNHRKTEEEYAKEYHLSEKEGTAAGEFLAYIIAGGLLGYGIDSYFESAPWGLLFFFGVGFAYAAYKATKTVTKDDD